MRKIRVLVVDDSPTMLQLLSRVLEADPEIEVVAKAIDAQSARVAIKELNPDVMTLDVEMPDMNGIQFLEKVMRLRPMPVIMVSTLTSIGSEIAIEALQLGALDCVVKPTPSNPDSFASLPQKIKAAAQSNLSARRPAAPVSVRDKQISKDFRPGTKIVAIGSSTGGVEALINVLSNYPENCAPTVITQHMPEHFTKSLANRLNRLCSATVVEASDGAFLKTGHVYLAPGGQHHLEVSGRGQLSCRLRKGDLVNGHRPSVDVLFNSVAQCAHAQSVGVILTGMGRDGAAGLLAMRQQGARTLGQNEATSIVYGMPRAAFENGSVGLQLPIDKIGQEITNLTASTIG
jgi:two-component system, chemotaxis family, protein-glutamate methylesterase/glutaminase